jgi:hypothetical protein
MIDIELHTPLLIRTEGNAGPYLLVPIQQIENVEAVLRAARIAFSISRDAVQLNGHDAIALVDFGRRADAAAIQAVLDAH